MSRLRSRASRERLKQVVLLVVVSSVDESCNKLINCWDFAQVFNDQINLLEGLEGLFGLKALSPHRTVITLLLFFEFSRLVSTQLGQFFAIFGVSQSQATDLREVLRDYDRMASETIDFAGKTEHLGYKNSTTVGS